MAKKKKIVRLSKNEKAAAKAGVSLKEYKSSRDGSKSSKKKSSTGSRLPSFSFDASKYLPGIQSTASSIFDPQIQTLGVDKQILDTETAGKKATTKAEFAQKLKDTVESINRRGGFFSGGAIKSENNLAEGEAVALSALDLENLRGTSGLQEKAGKIYGEKTKYITDQLEGKQSFAYKAFQDSLSNYFRQADLGLAQSRLASDNAFKQANYNLAVAKANKPRAVSATATKTALRNQAIDDLTAYIGGDNHFQGRSQAPLTGQDGYISPESYNSLKRTWTTQYKLPGTDFESTFGSYKNPADFTKKKDPNNPFE